MKGRRIVIALFLLCSTVVVANAQTDYKGRNGKVKFFSEAPLENIVAESNMTTSIFNEPTGEVAVLIPVKSFVFRKKLMQEHFNENYLESDKYPDASFTGKISLAKSLKEVASQVVNISGTLTIHGVSKQRDVNATLSVNADGALTAKGKFNVKLEDHNIKIPSLLFRNIAETVEVSFELQLKTNKP